MIQVTEYHLIYDVAIATSVLAWMDLGKIPGVARTRSTPVRPTLFGKRTHQVKPPISLCVISVLPIVGTRREKGQRAKD